MQALARAPSKSSHLSVTQLYLLLLSNNLSASSASPTSTTSRTAADPLQTRRRRTDATISTTARRSYRYYNDEESKAVKVSVWWDFENCSIPIAINAYLVAPRIVSALRSNGIRGPVTINAFGDMIQLSRVTQEALVSTGICLTHVPHSGKNSSDRSFMADLLTWTAQNPPPVHFFLISSDKDFATILHRLRMNNYNVILSSNDNASGALNSAATLMLPWTPLVRGEHFSTKCFNYPPDGPYGSWYGHFKGPLDDPFASSEQLPISQPEESMERINETKPKVIPKPVIENILLVLHKYPRGIALSTLRDELKRKNIIQKDLYGYKKFSHFVSALSDVLILLSPPHGENQPYVLARKKRVVPADPSEEKPVRIVEEPVVEENLGSGDDKMEEDSFVSNPQYEEGILGKLRYILFGSSSGNTKEEQEQVSNLVKCEERGSLVSNPKCEMKEKKNDLIGFKPEVPDVVKFEGESLVWSPKFEMKEKKDDSIGFKPFEWISKWLRFGSEKEEEKEKSNDLSPQIVRNDDIITEENETHQQKVKLVKKTNITVPNDDDIISEQNGTHKQEKSKSKSKTPPSRDEIISNCSKLVDELLKQNPKGFELSIFKLEFKKKFQFVLNNETLGYPKLSSLLQILPGIKIDPISTRVYKSNDKKHIPNGEDTDGEVPNGEDFDELGPVSKEGIYSAPSLSDEEFSDELMELDSENKIKSQSPLVQILDSWYGTKEKECTKENREVVDGLVDCSRRDDSSNSNKNNYSSEKNEDLGLGFKEKKSSRVLRRGKSRYSFVPNENGEDKENELVGSILDCLKQAGDSKASVLGKSI